MSNRYIQFIKVKLDVNKNEYFEILKYPIRKNEDGNTILNMIFSEDKTIRDMMLKIILESNRVDETFKRRLINYIIQVENVLFKRYYYWQDCVQIKDSFILFSRHKKDEI
jgi:hypothetical protein